jgi:NAD(P)-dependent dehydrogenase (short-subunit alcohol dehydrogenase family)
VLGGTSEIALAIVGELQRRAPREVVLVGRDGDALAGAAADLRAAGCPRASTLALEALDTGRHAQLVEQAFAELGGADIVILAVGVLGEREDHDVGGGGGRGGGSGGGGARARGRRTSSTGPPRPVSTRSPAASATRCTTRACASWSCVPASCERA